MTMVNDPEYSSGQGSTDVDEDGNSTNPDQHGSGRGGMDVSNFDETARTIFAYAILDIDVSEIVSPERVTRVCAKFGPALT